VVRGRGKKEDGGRRKVVEEGKDRGDRNTKKREM